MAIKYFKNVKDVKTLISMWKALARENHPDMGGDKVMMQEINAEFEMLKATLPKQVKEQVDTEVSEFYTEFGWKGSNYSFDLSLKDIAARIREFCKTMFPECKFSITTDYASMCCELHIALMESPYRCNKTFEELTDNELYSTQYSYNYQFGLATDDAQKIRFLKECYTKEIKEICDAVNEYVSSYRYNDSDGRIDYFDTNFYYFGCKVGKWNKPYVENPERLAKKRKVLVNI